MHLRGASYGCSKRAFVWGISPKLVKTDHPCSNTCFSELEWGFAKIQKPRTIKMMSSCHGTGSQDSGIYGRQATARNSGKHHSIFTNFGKMTWNGLFQKFKNLKSLVWSALAFGKWQLTQVNNIVLIAGPGSITPKEANTGILGFSRGLHIWSLEYLSWHVDNT